MSIKKFFCGSGVDRMPDLHFRFMSFMFVIRDLVAPARRKVERFGITEGSTVIDYGCGPGSYLPEAARLVGARGRVYAADVHDLAIESVKRRIGRLNLNNVFPVLISEYQCPIKNDSADLVYALDMFHMVKRPDLFLAEIRRMIKKGGRLIIEDGHQPRSESKKKILESGLFRIIQENRSWMECAPA